MRELLRVTLTFALLLGCCALAVTVFADRALFTAPPDAIAEGFTREVMTKRWDRARALLTDPDSMTRAQLEALQSHLGDSGNVESHTVSRDATRSLVEVTVESKTLRVALVWEGGWRVGGVKQDHAISR